MGASVQPDLDALIAERRKALASPGDDLDGLIAERRKALAAPTEDGPGFVRRGLSNAATGLAHMVMHPIDTAENAIVQPIKSAFTAAVAPGVGEARPDARLSKGGNSSGRPIDTTPYDAEHGGVTPKERTAAGVQSVVNAAVPGVFNPIKRAIGATGALAVSGGAAGAANNPNDPAAGFVSGAVSTPVVGAAVKAGAKVTDLASKALRVRSATPLDENAVGQTNAMRAADAVNYGQAAEEGQANGGTSPALQQALNHRRVKPFADLYRDSEGAATDDATIAREADKLMTRQWKGMKAKIARDGYDAKIALDIKNLKAGQQQLRDAAATASTIPAKVAETPPRVIPDREPQTGPIGNGPLKATTTAPNPTLSQGLRNFHGNTENAMQGPAGPAFQLRGQPGQVIPGRSRVVTPEQQVPPVMPSYPDAVAEHAERERARAQFNTGADAARRIMNPRSLPAKKLDGKSKAGALNDVAAMSPTDAADALKGTLGRAKEEMTIHAPHSMSTLWGSVSGLGRPIVKLNRVSPFIDALDRQAGNAGPLDPSNLLQYLPFITGSNTKP